MRKLLLIAALVTLGSSAALAQVTTRLPASLASLSTHVQSGASIELLDASGAVVAKINADGTLTLADGASLRDVRKAVLVTRPGTQPTTVEVSAEDAMKLEAATNPGGHAVNVPAVAAINMAMAAQKAADAGQPAGTPGSAQTGQDAATETPTAPVTPPAPPSR